MPGPCSLPTGPRAAWQEMNEIVCELHYNCDMDTNKKHEYVTLRMWLAKRGRLTTGKTM